MGTPTVSVILPTYNRADTLGSAIESVLRQTFDSFELLIVDDGSTDGTGSVLQRITDPRVQVIRNPVNRGVSAARNAGIAEARAPFLAFQDSDDAWRPQKLERQLNRFKWPDDLNQ